MAGGAQGPDSGASGAVGVNGRTGGQAERRRGGEAEKGKQPLILRERKPPKDLSGFHIGAEWVPRYARDEVIRSSASPPSASPPSASPPLRPSTLPYQRHQQPDQR